MHIKLITQYRDKKVLASSLIWAKGFVPTEGFNMLLSYFKRNGVSKCHYRLI